MALIGRLHPLLVHFPIALVLVALAAEGVASATGSTHWRTFAIGNVRGGAALALIATFAGWRLALDPGIDAPALLEWHRWLGLAGAVLTAVAAAASPGASHRSPRSLWIYRGALVAAAVLVGITGHIGGVLVWGADFVRL